MGRNDDMKHRGLRPVTDPEIRSAMAALAQFAPEDLLKLAAHDWVLNLRLKGLLEGAELNAETVRREALVLVQQAAEERDALIEQGKEMQRQELAQQGGEARVAKWEPVRQEARRLTKEKVPPSGRWPSKRQAALAIKDEVMAYARHQGCSMSENQAEKTITGWLGHPHVACLFASKQDTSASK